MANVTFNRCEKTELDNTPITDGMLSFCTDEETIYMDTTTDRKKYGGNASFVELTQEQYDALSYDEKHNGNGYLVEIEGDQWTANNIQYTETQSVKSAIDEIKSGGVDKKVTQAQYDALSEAEKKNGTTYYIETETDQWNADNIKYDNDNSVKDVIDDLNDTITNKKLFIDTSRILDNHASSGVDNVSYTATEDCYVNVWSMDGNTARNLYLDGVLIANSAYASVGTYKVYNLSASFYMKKGQVMTGTGLRYIVIGLKN